MSEFLVKELLTVIPQVGRLEWIGLRPGHRAPVQVVNSVRAEEGRGLLGDRYAQSPGTKRQVTLLQAEHLPLIGALTGHAALPPEWLRRNLVIAGINLLALKLLRPGGFLVTFSCSGGIDAALFQKIVASAAVDAAVQASIVARLGQAGDHPVSLSFPEGTYLKGLICRRGS